MYKLENYSNKEITHLLRSIAAVHQLKGKNRFRTIAYENAADAVEHLSREIKDVWEEGKIYQVPGIGEIIGSSLNELFKQGRSKHFDSILAQVPTPVFELMKVRSIGPKRAYKLVTILGLDHSDNIFTDLKKAGEEGKIAEIENFGKKSEQEIIAAINLYRQRSAKADRMPIPYAKRIADEVINYLKNHPQVMRVDALGSLRRWEATIGDVDLAVQVKREKLNGKSYKNIIDYFIKYPKKIKVENAGENKASIIVSPNIRIDLRIQEEAGYGSMLQYFTGSKAHNIKLREHALAEGFSLNEYGLKKIRSPSTSLRTSPKSPPQRKGGDPRNNSQIMEFSNEHRLYEFVDLQYIPPEIREGTNEIELAQKNQIPKLVEVADIKGDLHVHSSYNLQPSHDLGENTYEEMLKKAKELKYQYLGFAEHNPKTSGLNEKEIIEIMKKRYLEIEKIRDAEIKVKCFIGLEADILPDGSLALPEKAIDYVDYLVVSVHSAFNLNVKAMTERVLKALEYPKVKALGHPTGRLLGKREGFELDWERIFNFCARKNIALEINSWPQRLDLPDTLAREGLRHEVKYIINTDAHATQEMEGMRYGVSVARRGWCGRSDIINTLNYSAFKKWLNNKS